MRKLLRRLALGTALGVGTQLAILAAPAQALPQWPPLVQLSGICEDGTNPWSSSPCHFVLRFSALGGQGGSLQAVTVAGTAQPQADFVPVSTWIPISPTATRAVITVNVVPDDLCEPPETFTLVLSGGSLGQTVMQIPRTIKDGDC